jgi:hypothetical protein
MTAINNDWTPTYSWLAAAVCMVLSGNYARRLKAPPPRVFLAVAFYSLAWAVLIPYYFPVDSHPIYIFGTLRGIFLMFCGSMLFHEGANCKSQTPYIARTMPIGHRILDFKLGYCDEAGRYAQSPTPR